MKNVLKFFFKSYLFKILLCFPKVCHGQYNCHPRIVPNNFTVNCNIGPLGFSTNTYGQYNFLGMYNNYGYYIQQPPRLITVPISIPVVYYDNFGRQYIRYQQIVQQQWVYY